MVSVRSVAGDVVAEARMLGATLEQHAAAAAVQTQRRKLQQVFPSCRGSAGQQASASCTCHDDTPHKHATGVTLLAVAAKHLPSLRMRATAPNATFAAPQASTCQLAMGDQTTSYGACATFQTLPSVYKLYYSYEPSTGTVEGAFAYPNPSGWAAWGINPGQPGQMLGGSAFVVKSNASAASGEAV